MSIINCQPLQPLRNNRFTLSFGKDDLSPLEGNITAASIPGISAQEAIVSNRNRTGKVPGDIISYDNLDISFIVDEKLSNYISVYNWILNNRDETKQVICDGTLIIYSAKNNPIVYITFVRMFPVSLGRLPFDIQDNSTDPIKCDTTFVYDRYEIKSGSDVTGEEIYSSS